MIPKLIFYKTLNPDFGKTFTLEDVKSPTEQDFGWVIGDYATRGRTIPSFDEWSKNCQQGELKRKQASALCQYILCKHPVESEEQITEFFKSNPNFIQT